MGFHTFDAARADDLEDPSRYRYLSADELLALFDPMPYQTVADLGSGTGFYADDVAPCAGTLYAVDVQASMHDYYREKGAPENVAFVVADVADLPFDDGELDGAYSTMTFHEFAGGESLSELARAIAPGGLLGVGDWSANGEGSDGPPTGERFTLAEAVRFVREAGFDVECARERRETFVLRARRRG